MNRINLFFDDVYEEDVEFFNEIDDILLFDILDKSFELWSYWYMKGALC